MPARSSFPREISLKNQSEIKTLFQAGRRISGEYFSLIWEVGESEKFGIFLSRAHGKAARRNRIKRLYREAVRLNRHLLTRPVTVAILPNTRVEQPGFNEINVEIEHTFKLIADQPE